MLLRLLLLLDHSAVATVPSALDVPSVAGVSNALAYLFVAGPVVAVVPAVAVVHAVVGFPTVFAVTPLAHLLLLTFTMLLAILL
jgi:hypothetical protein